MVSTLPSRSSRESVAQKKATNLLILLAIVLTNVFVYHDLASHHFVNIDDGVYVVGNACVKSGLTADSIRWAFTTLHAEFWHPLTWLSYMLDTDLYGVRPAGYLSSNLILHILNSGLLFIVLNQLTRDIWASALVALLFAVHPCHVETVAWVSDRKDLLSAFFFMLSLGAYKRYVDSPGGRRMFVLLLVFLCGLMSKPNIVILPGIFLLIDVWPLGRLQISEGWPRPRHQMVIGLIREKIPLILLAVVFGVLAIVAQYKGGGVGSLTNYTLTDRLSNAVFSYAMYLYKAFWPQNLTIFYPFIKQLPIWKTTISAIALIAISLICIRSRQNSPYFLVGWLWFLLSLIPVIGAIKIGDFAMADRYTYLPHIGLYIMAAWGASAAARRIRHPIPIALLACIVIAGLAVVSERQVRHWRDSGALFAHALRVTPDSYFAHYAMGNAMAEKRQYPAAVAHFAAASKLAPEKAFMMIDHGRALITVLRFEEASEVLNRVLEKNSPYRLDELHFLLGLSLTGQKKSKQAALHFIAALENTCNAAPERQPCSSSRTLPQAKACMAMENIDKLAADGRLADAFTCIGIPGDPRSLRRLSVSGYERWLERIPCEEPQSHGRR